MILFSIVALVHNHQKDTINSEISIVHMLFNESETEVK